MHYSALHGRKASGSLSLSEIHLALQSSLNQTAGAIMLAVDNKHFIPKTIRVASSVQMQRSANKPNRPASCW